MNTAQIIITSYGASCVLIFILMYVRLIHVCNKWNAGEGPVDTKVTGPVEVDVSRTMLQATFWPVILLIFLWRFITR